MAINSDAVIIPGTGNLFVAPEGTALPTDIDEALDAAFVDMGAIHEDGATFSDGKTAGSAIFAWQSRDPVRRTAGNSEPTLSMELREWSKDTFPVVFGGGTVSATTNGHQYTPPTNAQNLRRVVVLEMDDGTRKYRLMAGAATVEDASETNMTRTDNASLPVAFQLAIPDGGTVAWEMLTNAPAFT